MDIKLLVWGRDTVAPSGVSEDDTNVAVSLGILTTDTSEQTIEWSGSRADSKGVEAALVAIKMNESIYES